MSRIKQPLNKKASLCLSFVGISCLIIGYEILSYRQHVKNPLDTTIPSFTQMWEGLKTTTIPKENNLIAAFGGTEEKASLIKYAEKSPLFKNQFVSVASTMSRIGKMPIYRDITSTYSRLIKGLLLGCTLSIVIGVWMGCYDSIAALFLAPLSFLANVPGTAMLAVFFVMVGTGEVMFGTMIGFGILPTLTKSVYLNAKHDLHDEEINKAYTLGASNMEVIYNVVFKQILPKIFENVRLQIGPAMVYLIAAEMLVGEVGMGYQIRMQQRLLNMNIVYDYLIILGVIGLITDKGMLSLRRKICPWYSRFG
jgi:NitT/TauT family transport system permease protein